VEPELNRKRAQFVLSKIDEILAWDQRTETERDTRFVELGRYLCEVRAGQYWRLEKLSSFDDFLTRRFPESRRKAYYLMSIHENLPPQANTNDTEENLGEGEFPGSTGGGGAGDGSASTGGALGTWQSLGPGNVGGRTRALLIDPSNPAVMYAAAVAGGIWKTTNAGTSWAPLNDFLANIAVTSMAFDPSNSNTIYAGTGEGFFNADGVRGAGIFKSNDAGAHWTRLAATISNANFFFVSWYNSQKASPFSVQRLTR